MGLSHRNGKDEFFSQSADVEKSPSNHSCTSYSKEGGLAETDPATALHRGLKARQVTMIAIGGAIGTGLIIGTGSSLAKAGPGSIFISYSVVGVIVWLVMCALGEMATWLPMESGFTGYATRFCDPALGLALGWTYWFKYIIVTPNQLTAAALVIQYWVPREQVNPGVFIAVFLIVIVLINYLGIRFFGEFEFWLSSVKVLTIVGLIVLCFVLMLGSGPDHDRKGFRYWSNPGAFREAYTSKVPFQQNEMVIKANGFIAGDTGRFLALWSTFTTATFAYLGTELVGVTVGEAQNPRRVIPKAIKLTFWRILFFYVLSVLLIGTLVPYNSQNLVFATKATTGASASPFVVAIIEAGIPKLPGFINACILLFVFSAANSDLYIATRTIYGLAKEGRAPKMFARTNSRGVPYVALAVSALIACIAFLNCVDSSKVVFGYFVNLVTIFGLLTWVSILVTHIHFVKARIAQGILKKDLVYSAPLGINGSYLALAFCCIIALFKNFDAFIYSDTRTYSPSFGYKEFITGYLGIPLYLGLIFGYKFVTRTRGLKPHEVDLFAGKAAIDKEEAEFLAAKEATGTSTKRGAFYERYIAWLF